MLQIVKFVKIYSRNTAVGRSSKEATEFGERLSVLRHNVCCALML